MDFTDLGHIPSKTLLLRGFFFFLFFFINSCPLFSCATLVPFHLAIFPRIYLTVSEKKKSNGRNLIIGDKGWAESRECNMKRSNCVAEGRWGQQNQSEWTQAAKERKGSREQTRGILRTLM